MTDVKGSGNPVHTAAERETLQGCNSTGHIVLKNVFSRCISHMIPEDRCSILIERCKNMGVL